MGHERNTDADRQREQRREQGKEQRIGKPHDTSREAVEEGKPREGTNLDIGEERSREQQREAEQARRSS